MVVVKALALSKKCSAQWALSTSDADRMLERETVINAGAKVVGSKNVHQ
jgi:hypothetical protein